jgi:hypothetical protein
LFDLDRSTTPLYRANWYLMQADERSFDMLSSIPVDRYVEYSKWYRSIEEGVCSLNTSCIGCIQGPRVASGAIWGQGSFATPILCMHQVREQGNKWQWTSIAPSKLVSNSLCKFVRIAIIEPSCPVPSSKASLRKGVHSNSWIMNSIEDIWSIVN